MPTRGKWGHWQNTNGQNRITITLKKLLHCFLYPQTKKASRVYVLETRNKCYQLGILFSLSNIESGKLKKKEKKRKKKRNLNVISFSISPL